jgi:hypothetical protein
MSVKGGAIEGTCKIERCLTAVIKSSTNIDILEDQDPEIFLLCWGGSGFLKIVSHQ